eukprot:7390354-Prymnesium_polylepis.1
MFAFTPPTHTGPHDTDRPPTTAPCSAPASIGSPSAVPVPCASAAPRLSAEAAASASEARSRPCCACPLGAVRLALRPSHRTAHPPTTTRSSAPASVPTATSTTATHASPRAYPSALASNVWLRPVGDVMPANAQIAPDAGPSISDRTPAWNATSAAEQAVSYAAHAPCRPSTYDSRPDAIERALPVAAYTLAPAGDAASTPSNSCAPMPTYTPVRLPPTADRSRPLPCSA